MAHKRIPLASSLFAVAIGVSTVILAIVGLFAIAADLKLHHHRTSWVPSADVRGFYFLLIIAGMTILAYGLSGCAVFGMPESRIYRWLVSPASLAKNWLFSIMAAIFVIMFTAFVNNNGKFVFDVLFPFLGDWLAFSLTVVLLAIGYALFRLKIAKLLLYAKIELGFAAASCYLSIERIRTDPSVSNFAVLFASLYLIVRGLDNRKTALNPIQQTTVET
jgi:hypothetical protein